MPPNNVVIVGGSISGLLHAIKLKRQGSNVMVLEQDPAIDRSSQGAGINIGPNMQEFLSENDATGMKLGIHAECTKYARRKRAKVEEAKAPRQLTSWGLLYRVLRAYFDGMASTPVPHPPSPREGDGHVEYQRGKKVIALRYDRGKELVVVEFVDVTSGEEESITADLVIGADGIHSTVRQLVETDAQTKKEYSGYVAWRGTVPERLVSTETAEYFANRVVASLMKRSYMIIYVIPTDNGGFGPSERLLNFVWYHNIAEGSPEMTSVFTDIHGKVHQNTILAGLVQPEQWQRQLASYVSQMPVPVAELVSKTDSPFVTKVNDLICKTPSFHNGHVVLVGDARTAIRPHNVLGSDIAAKHCTLLSKVWRGEMAIEEWGREVLVYGTRMVLLSRVIGLLGQGTIYTFLKALVTYIWFIIRARRG